ncbi:hypothetical protein JCM17380_13120 [Desulfosporosinus burensis]
MYAGKGIEYPSNLNELNRITSEQAELIVEENIRTLHGGMDILGCLTHLENVFESIIEMRPVAFPKSIATSRKAIKDVDELLKTFKAMYVECQKPCCMILIAIEFKIVYRVKKMVLNIYCDDMVTNKMQVLRVYSTYPGKYSGKYNVLYTVGKSLRGR